jgi:D-beta-D-heptose 7-phosphate kinase/D-beta-D-heptose 1-phosphate adenosyltransferase
MIHNPNVLIVGDLMIDEWIYGETDRISPEAPIPIVDVGISNKQLGGAGNVYQNVKSLGGDPHMITGTSQTVHGHWLENMVQGWFYNIPRSFVKKRIVSGQQQIVRLDYGQGRKITDIECEQALSSFEDEHIDIVVIADYGKGTVTDIMLHDLVRFCDDRNIKLLVDPYKADYYFDESFKCDLVKLNKSEAEYFTGVKITEDSLPDVGRILFDTFDTYQLLVTLGYDGVAYFDRHKYKRNPFMVQDNPLYVYDVCGAGDVVIAVLAYLMCYRPWETDIKLILRYATEAGKIAVSKRGTSVVTHKEIFGGVQ